MEENWGMRTEKKEEKLWQQEWGADPRKKEYNESPILRGGREKI